MRETLWTLAALISHWRRRPGNLATLVLGLAIATPLAMAGAVFYIIHHLVVKANLFFVAGAIHRATGTYDLRQAGGLMKASPLLAVVAVASKTTPSGPTPSTRETASEGVTLKSTLP